MQQILDAITSGTATAEDFAAMEVPASYRGATVHRDEVEMFAGMDAELRHEIVCARMARLFRIKGPAAAAAKPRATVA